MFENEAMPLFPEYSISALQANKTQNYIQLSDKMFDFKNSSLDFYFFLDFYFWKLSFCLKWIIKPSYKSVDAEIYEQINEKN